MDSLLSIIIPAYNSEEYIEQTVLNVLSQNYRPFEVIVVDDGSQDQTGTILDRLASNHSEYLHILHIPNSGVTGARLAGVRAAKGDWIGFVDGDDFIDPNMYVRLIENAIKYNADISHCGYTRITPISSIDFHNTCQLVIQDRCRGMLDLLRGNLVEPSLWNKLFRASLLSQLLDRNVLDTSIRINEDLMMNFFLFQQANKSVFEDVCLYKYIFRSTSASNGTLKEHHLSDPKKVRKLIMEHCIDIPEVYPSACEVYVHHLISAATRPIKTNPDLVRASRKSALEELRFLIPQKLPIGKKIRLMSYWVALAPISYRIIHSVYSKLKGYDKLYEIK